MVVLVQPAERVQLVPQVSDVQVQQERQGHPDVQVILDPKANLEMWVRWVIRVLLV